MLLTKPRYDVIHGKRVRNNPSPTSVEDDLFQFDIETADSVHRDNLITRYEVRSVFQVNLLTSAVTECDAIRAARAKLKATWTQRTDNFLWLSPWTQVDDAVSGWAKLQDGWDGDQSIAPPKRAIVAIRTFIEAAKKSLLKAPRAYLTSEGEIGLHWSSARGRATISLLPEDEFLAFVRADGAPVLRTRANFDGMLKFDLIEALRKI